MPLRDHFRPPIWNLRSWEGFHGMWPALIVQRLVSHLPEDYIAEPRVHLGTNFEIDVCAFESDQAEHQAFATEEDSGGVATATATYAPPHPTLVVDADIADQYQYEVRVYASNRARRLVAAVELVSPGNKDRPENRRALVTKCAALLQEGVCVAIVDLVTTRQFNLYAELLALIDQTDPTMTVTDPPIYAVTCRGRKIDGVPKLETWAHPLVIGRRLPTLPLWLSDDMSVPLELESSYEDTCHVLRIG